MQLLSEPGIEPLSQDGGWNLSGVLARVKRGQAQGHRHAYAWPQPGILQRKLAVQIQQQLVDQHGLARAGGTEHHQPTPLEPGVEACDIGQRATAITSVVRQYTNPLPGLYGMKFRSAGWGLPVSANSWFCTCPSCLATANARARHAVHNASRSTDLLPFTPNTGARSPSTPRGTATSVAISAPRAPNYQPRRPDASQHQDSGTKNHVLRLRAPPDLIPRHHGTHGKDARNAMNRPGG